MSALPFYFAPTSKGMVELNATALVLLNGKMQEEKASGYSFADYISGNNGSQQGTAFTAYLSQNNASIAYPSSAQEPVYRIVVWNHCQPYSCGSGAWQITTNWPSCNYIGTGQMAFCAEKAATGTSVETISSQGTFAYDTVLSLRNSTLSVAADLVSGRNASELQALNGTNYGSASVSSVAGDSGYAKPYYAQGAYAINESGYNTFENQWASLVNELAAYNNTYPGQFGSIDWWLNAINVYNSEEQGFLGTPAATVPTCHVTAGSVDTLTCSVSSLLDYSINARLSGMQSGNAMLQYLSSTINVT
jgi:hypothetical protein